VRLIIVRHAETIENATGIISGHKPGILTDNGKVQAQKLALRLKEEKIDEIFSSDLQRAKDTTEEIAKYHDVPVHYMPEIRERCLGIYENSKFDDYVEAREALGISRFIFKPEGGENFDELKARAQIVLNKFLGNFEYYKDKTILISAHGGWNTMLLGILSKKTIEEALEVDQANTCVNIVEIGENFNPNIVLVNDVSHLEPSDITA